MRDLVLVHGRGQDNKDAIDLKREWLDSLREGLLKSGLELPIREDRVRFPYYGDTLSELSRQLPPNQVAEVIVRGNATDPHIRAFIEDMLDEIVAREGLTEEQVEAEAQQAVTMGAAAAIVERGPLNWGWVQGILSAIDRYVPSANAASLALLASDAYHYLYNTVVREKLESVVRAGMTPGTESIVVSHSLGTVVAYNVLRQKGEELGWRVPLFVTLGSPLAVKKIRTALQPNKHPVCVGAWFNVTDPDDVVSLYPLDIHHFPLSPTIENKTDVMNLSENQHGIRGYLTDPEVARRIYEALVTSS